MFIYLIKVTICWLGFYLIYSAFLKKETFFNINRWYLLGTLLLGAGIPLLELLPIFQEDHPAVIYFQPLNESVFYVQSTVSEVVAQSELDWMELFWSVYFLGVAVFGGRFFIGLGKIYQLYRAGEIHQKENHTLVITEKLHLPFSFFGYLFWSKHIAINEADSEKILTHETAHVNGWHSVDVILCEVMSIIFWCSPMVYFYKKSIKTVHEYLADSVVLQTTPKKKYGHLLLQQSQSGLQVALANHFFHSQLKQRIIMMTRNKSRKGAIIKYLFALPVILLLLIVFAKKQAIANNENPTTEIIENFTDGEVDEMPYFPGCEDVEDKKQKRLCSDKKLLTYIYSNIKYPKEARKAGIQGKVVIKYTVQKDGTVANAQVVKKIGGGCDEAALSVVNALPKMIPAIKDGKPVDVEMTLPVKFRLERDENVPPPPPPPTLEQLKNMENVEYIIDGKKTTGAAVEKLSNEDIATMDLKKGEKVIDGEQKEFHLLDIRTKKGVAQLKENVQEEINVVGFSPKLDTNTPSDEVFNVVDEMPRFPGCEDLTDEQEKKLCAEGKMLTHVYSKLKYPKAAREAGIEGRVITQFVIQKDGSIGDVKIIRDIGGGCGEEVVRVMKEMPRWIPGKQDGEPVSVKYTLPVAFKLGSKNKENATTSPDGKPLIIINGKEWNDESRSLDKINPKQIETVDVLKGKAAISSYGEAAKNGVIIIQLKEGGDQELILKEEKSNTPSPLLSRNEKMKAAGLLSVKISPNPTSEAINIELDSEEGLMEIIGYDTYGKELFRFETYGGNRTFSDLKVTNTPKGTIYVAFKKDGKVVYTEMVIVQ